jgi:hypothetical protein
VRNVKKEVVAPGIQSGKRARRVLDEIAREGGYSLDFTGGDFPEFKKTEPDGKEIRITAEKLGPKQYQVIRKREDE